MLAGMGVLVLAAVTALLMRRNKESRELVTANSNSPMTGERQTGVVAYRPENLISETGFAPPPISYREIQIKRQIQNLKDDIAQFFIRQPKNFKRCLHQDFARTRPGRGGEVCACFLARLCCENS